MTFSAEWFNKSFIPQATEKIKSGKPILLIYDGHGSHEQLELISIACDCNIILFCLLPHTTHKLQPLDVSVFGPFQHAWSEQCNEIVEDTRREMPCENFIKEYMGVCSQTFKPTTIVTAFWKGGSWPVSCDVFTDEDYAPSIPMSTSHSHIPGSFPLSTDTVTRDQDPDSKSSNGSPTYPISNDSSDDDDKSSDDNPADAINNSENSQTHTTSPPPASHPAPTVPTQPPLSLQLPSHVPNSPPFTSRGPPLSLSCGLTKWLKQKHPTGQPITPLNSTNSQLYALSQAYSELEKEGVKLCSKISVLKSSLYYCRNRDM
jgi:hypothetical protein